MFLDRGSPRAFTDAAIPPEVWQAREQPSDRRPLAEMAFEDGFPPTANAVTQPPGP